MKYLTPQWWADCQRLDWQSDEVRSPMEQYKQYYASVKPQLPVEFVKFKETYSLHDATFLSMEVDVERCEAHLNLIISVRPEKKPRYEKECVLFYSGVSSFGSSEKRDFSLSGLSGHGDLGYDEIEVIGTDSYQHRMLFASGIEFAVSFSGFNFETKLLVVFDEDVLAMFGDLYTNPYYEAEELRELLSQHPDHRLILDKWEQWAQDSSSQEKEVVFHQWVWKHPNRPADFPSPEDYLEIMADRERQKIEKQLQIERDAESRRLDLQRVATNSLDETEIEFILLSKEPGMLLALANNSQIDVQWIQKLVNCHQVKGARQIREAADSNIKARQQ